MHWLFTIETGLNHQNKKNSILRVLIWLWYNMACALSQSKWYFFHCDKATSPRYWTPWVRMNYVHSKKTETVEEKEN